MTVEVNDLVKEAFSQALERVQLICVPGKRLQNLRQKQIEIVTIRNTFCLKRIRKGFSIW